MDSSEIWLMGGHQRAVEGSSLPPCLQGGCQETLPLQGFRGREDKEGRIIVSAIPAGSLAWRRSLECHCLGSPPSPGLVCRQVSWRAGLGLSLISAHSQVLRGKEAPGPPWSVLQSLRGGRGQDLCCPRPTGPSWVLELPAGGY